ncbi:TPA: hypothetical protein ACKP70_001811, partial [Stenotrophomonas maltophilia]
SRDVPERHELLLVGVDHGCSWWVSTLVDSLWSARGRTRLLRSVLRAASLALGRGRWSSQ